MVLITQSFLTSVNRHQSVMLFNFIFNVAIVREDKCTGLFDTYQNMTVMINYVSFRRLGKLMLITYKLFYFRID
jgi:hypothetical protein